MRRTGSRIGRTLAAGLVVLAAGCGARHETARAPAAGEHASATAASLHDLTFGFTDADGRTRHLSDFRGQPFVASMVYTNCVSVCPRIIADLQGLDRALPEDVRARTKFVLFSLDPERDTPQAMRAFAKMHGLDPARWTLLAASPDDMRTLAAVLDVRFRPDVGGQIAHSAVIVVVDRDGAIRHRQAGLKDDDSELVEAVREVEAG